MLQLVHRSFLPRIKGLVTRLRWRCAQEDGDGRYLGEPIQPCLVQCFQLLYLRLFCLELAEELVVLGFELDNESMSASDTRNNQPHLCQLSGKLLVRLLDDRKRMGSERIRRIYMFPERSLRWFPSLLAFHRLLNELL